MTKKMKPLKKTSVTRKAKQHLRAGTDDTGARPTGEKIIPWLELTLTASLMLILIILHFTVLLHSGGGGVGDRGDGGGGKAGDEGSREIGRAHV